MAPNVITDGTPFYRCVLEFSGYPGAGIGLMTTGFWVHDTAGVRSIATAAVDIAAVVVAADPDDDAHERENRPSNSVIDLLRVSRPLVEFQPAPVEVALGIPGDQGASTWSAPEVSMVASLKTDVAGPAFRGRMYFPHPSSSANVFDTAAGTFQAAAATRLNTTISAIRTGLLADDFELITVTQYHVETPGQPPVKRVQPYYAAVTSNFVDAHTDSQRRRGVR